MGFKIKHIGFYPYKKQEKNNNKLGPKKKTEGKIFKNKSKTMTKQEAGERP